MEGMCRPGTAVPELDIVSLEGKQKNICDLQGKWVVLLFRRYLGCPLCRMELDSLTLCHITGAGGELQPACQVPENTEVIIFIQSDPAVVREELAGKLPEGMTAVADPEGLFYQKFGIGRANLIQYAAPRVLLKLFRAGREGYRRGRVEGEARQLPAELIIDPKGIIRYKHVARDISDIVPLEELFRVKETIAGGSE